MKSLISQSQLLVQSLEGHITVRTTEVAVIALRTDNVSCEVVMGVNCLRAGCPAVQFFFDGDGTNHFEAEHRRIIKKMAAVLCALEVHKFGDKTESFNMSGTDEKSIKKEEVPFVITVTRSTIA